MSREIQLGRGLVAIVDDDDYERLSQYKWHPSRRNRNENKFYAKRSVWLRGQGKQVNEYMHAAVICVPKGYQVDHRNGDTLDNRKSNLRIATHAQNQQNQGPLPGRKYKGVGPYGSTNKPWTARIQDRTIGTYPTEEEAARAYDAEARKRYGEFAYLNFPTEKEINDVKNQIAHKA